jgi:hypothetical protein
MLGYLGDQLVERVLDSVWDWGRLGSFWLLFLFF